MSAEYPNCPFPPLEWLLLHFTILLRQQLGTLRRQANKANCFPHPTFCLQKPLVVHGYTICSARRNRQAALQQLRTFCHQWQHLWLRLVLEQYGPRLGCAGGRRSVFQRTAVAEGKKLVGADAFGAATLGARAGFVFRSPA